MKLIRKDCSVEIEKILDEENQIIVDSFRDQEYIIHAKESEEQGYRIQVNGREIHILYHEKIDFCRALFMLCSREEPDGIKDQRIFEEFGMMVDVSRNAVLKTETLRQLIRMLALMGYNFIGLYMEDTIKVEGEPYLGYMRGALTPEEIQDIDQYAAIFGMELRPYIQTLAHYNQITRYEDYQSCLDFGDILLVGEEKTYEFLDKVIKTVADHFPSKKINIGMDEAHMVGLGKYLDQNGYEKRFDIMEKHLNRVFSICRKYGLKVQMWSDMFFRLAFGGEYYVQQDAKLPDIKIPDDVELVYWDYYSCEQKKYDEMLKLHLKITDKVGFAGGAWKWTGFAPHNGYSIEAGKAALGACRENKIQSVVITAWGDNGAETSIFSILPSLFFDANLAYTAEISKVGFKNLTGIPYEGFLEIDKSNPYTEYADKHNNASKYLLYNDALMGTFDSVSSEKLSDYYEETEKQLGALQLSETFGYIFATQAGLCRVLKRKANLGNQIREAYDKKEIVRLKEIAVYEIPELLADLDSFYQKFKNQWRQESKSFGFEVQSIRIGGLKQRLLDIEEELLDYCDAKIKIIEELEEERYPYHYSDDHSMETLDYNLWSNIVTPAVIG